MRIKLAQINTVTGDLINNSNKIKNILLESVEKNDCDMIIYPETAFSGYCCGALWDRQEFILDQEKLLHELFLISPSEMCVIIGFVSYHGMRKNGFPRLRNSVAVINDGRIQVYDKQLLANTGHHEDRKYFESGKETKVFDVKIKDKTFKIGTPICEDVWYLDHTRNIPKEMVELGAEILISVNQSYFYYGKNKVRWNMYSDLINKLKVPFITVNAVGIGDIGKNILIYDGSSMYFNNQGNLIKILKSFDEDTLIIEDDFYKFSSNTRHPYYLKDNKFDEITRALVFATKEIFRLNNIKKAQIHLSGGLDSSLVLVLAVLALGKENVVVITNPSSCNTKKIYKNVEHIVKKLGLKLYVNPIQEIFEKILEVDKQSFPENLELDDAAQSCIQATLRTCLGLYNAHRFKTALISTTNHTELCLGFSSYLDISYAGILALIADLSKVECYQLSEYLNKELFNDEIIPKSLYDGSCKASAELPDNKGEDPIDYFIQSGVCCEVIRKNKSKKQIINYFKNKTLTEDYFPILEIFKNKTIYEHCTLETFTKELERTFKGFKGSVYKTEQCPPVPTISPYNRGFSKRETLINKYNY
jgi:NAD+ synthase (glutamine-hydrolysing)